MDKNLSKKIESLTLELTETPSIVGTVEENNVVEKIYEKFGEMDYFKEHPENLLYIPVKDDPLKRKSVMTIVKGAKENNLPIEDMQKLNLPVINIGPFGKDAHKFTERLEKDYSFNIVPKIVYQAIIDLLKS